MSKIIEETALEKCRELDINCFCSVDKFLLHDIYNTAKTKKGFRPLKREFPRDIINRVRTGMKTCYYFSRIVVPNRVGRISIYRIKEKCNV